MDELVLEVGFKLEGDFDYYDVLLKNNGLENVFSVITHDIYYTNQSLDGMSENEMKNACIRLRNCSSLDKVSDVYKIQNGLGIDFQSNEILEEQLDLFEMKLENKGFCKVFDTKKVDKHYCKEGMTSWVQLQNIDDIGVVVYYDNSDYYKYPIDVQRKLLIDELNSYGFSMGYEQMGLDKLRTLYYKEDRHSLNQNG